MSSVRAHGNARRTGRSLSDRCRQLDLAAWNWDQQRSVTVEPCDNVIGRRWFGAPLLVRWISEAVERWTGHSPPSAHELFPGCWLLPVGGHDARRGAVGLLAMALGPEALQSEQFDAICGSAELDAQSSRATLHAIARYGRSQIQQLSTVLRWLHDDLMQIGQDRLVVQGFSAQLADLYEQMNVLYRLGLEMKQLDQPTHFIEGACGLLQTTLQFDWVAVLPSSGGRAVSAFTDPVIAGTLPASQRTFSKLVSRFSGGSINDDEQILLQPHTSELASFVGSEVVVCPVFGGGQMMAALIAGNKRGPDTDVSSIDTHLLKAVAGYLGAFLQNVFMFTEQHELFVGTLRALTATIDAKDAYTRGHSARVAWLATQLATSAGLAEDKARQLGIAGLVHDIGKIGVPEAVLGKRDKLTDEEFDKIKQHPVLGYEILKGIPPMAHALPAVLHHHERWDGGGYPEGRRADNIPFTARIITVADTFDAMSSDRTYREALDRSTVLGEIERSAGTQLDPELAALFVKLDLSGYYSMVARHQAQEKRVA